MARSSTAWIEYHGINSSLHNIKIMDPGPEPIFGVRGSSLTASGRDGDIWISDGSAAPVDRKVRVRVPLSKINDMNAWLNQSGTLRFSGRPDAAYDARFNRLGKNTKAIDLVQVTHDSDPLYEATLIFTLQPHPHIYPDSDDITITSTGALRTNPGTAPALPRVTIVGSGDFSVTIGLQTIYFTGVETGVIVDSELGDVLTSDGTLLANDKADGELWSIPPGSFAVSWAEGGSDDEGNTTSGSVTSVTITPRWRYL